MTARVLSAEIVSLIHHVELNKSGWWKKAIGQVIKGVLWTAQGPETLEEIKSGLKREVGIGLPDEILQRQVESLIGAAAVVRLPSGQYKLTEKTRIELSVARDAALADQVACHESFLVSCRQHCPSRVPEDVWAQFMRSLLEAVRVAGANLFHLLADGNLEREFDWVSRFLAPFTTSERQGLRLVLSEFFSPTNHVCRGQVLRLLSAHFFAEASQLSPATIASIEGVRKKRLIKVVLDTNFIFSVLQLHDNPADNAALSLIDLAQAGNSKLEIRLYVLPSTLEETQKTLINQMHLVERIRTTPAMSNAALSQPLPSIAKRFFDEARRCPGLTAQAFFQPYVDDLRTILMDKGINVLDVNSAIRTRQDVIDDILAETERQAAELPENKRKGYETLLHDVVLWHAVKDRRGDNGASPFEVEYWAVSIDWRLIAFDRRKRAKQLSALPVVLHPSGLVQLIQFWVPRTERLEESLIDTLRLPLFFQSFDPEDEKATIRVLEAISRFENVDDIPEPTLKIILANQVLRARLHEGDATNDEVFALVRDELLTQHKETVSALSKAQDNLAQTQASLDAEREGRERSARQLSDASKEIEEANKRATAAEKAREELVVETQAKLHILEQGVRKSELALAKERFVLLFWGIPWLIGAGLGYLAYQYLPIAASSWLYWLLLGLTVATPFAIACLGASRYLNKNQVISNWGLAQFTAVQARKAMSVPVTLGIAAIYQGGLWDVVKKLLGLGD